MFKACAKNEILSRAEQIDGVICFGTGKHSAKYGEVFSKTALWEKTLFFVDNNIDKVGSYVSICDREFLICSPEKIKEYKGKNVIIIITCVNYEEIVEQLDANRELTEFDSYYVDYFDIVQDENESLLKQVPDNLRISNEPLIPKKIHYCWFGGNPIPDKYKEWMESWKKHCPDYEIIEWNESNYDITKNKYMLQAYEQKRWGFVPDYARLDIIYEHGGIYLDTDVEIIKSFDDLLYQKAFAGFEIKEYVALGLGFGAVKGLPIIKELRDKYDEVSFIDAQGNLNLTTSPKYQTEVLKQKGLITNGEYQIVEDMTIYPIKMLCGKNSETGNTRLTSYSTAIHHFDGSWADDEKRKKWEKRRQLLNAAMQANEKTS